MGRGRNYSRMERVGELCREIVADTLERLDDPRLELVTITYVRVDPDLRHATVFFSSIARDEEEAAVALTEHRVELQREIARQARLKRTPELRFEVDEVIRAGSRVDEILQAERERRGEAQSTGAGPTSDRAAGSAPSGEDPSREDPSREDSSREDPSREDPSREDPSREDRA